MEGFNGISGSRRELEALLGHLTKCIAGVIPSFVLFSMPS